MESVFIPASTSSWLVLCVFFASSEAIMFPYGELFKCTVRTQCPMSALIDLLAQGLSTKFLEVRSVVHYNQELIEVVRNRILLPQTLPVILTV